MTDNAGIGIGGCELLQQFIKRVLLGLGTGVGSNAFGIETAFIDNTEGACVVMAGMYALDALWQQGNDTAVITDIVVIGTLAILGLAAGNEVLYAEGNRAFVCHAVNND